tara:strand:+ start:36489 stop:37694 length:1206 start_codon:yes stop_codon:yes gene_type:complete
VKVAYLVNQYPKVSHSFIRREILALERNGIEVQRIAVRGWDEPTPDPQDAQEKSRTQYVLKGGTKALAASVFKVFRSNPAGALSALKLAFRMGLRSDRPLPFHFIYFAEACQILLWLQAGEARHLHAHFGTNSAEVAMLVEALGGPGYSFTVHGPEEFDKPEFLHLGEKIRRSRFVVAITSFCRSQLFRWVDSSQWHKVKEVHCGIEPDFYRDVDLEPAGNRLVCVGRLSEQKGHLLLIEAAAIASSHGADFELVLAGDGELRAPVEQRIRELGLQQKVRITGWISSAQVREEILASRALVLASFAEGLPVVLMEAMALRRPVLTTCVAGVPELVRQGESGWLYPAGDVDLLAQAMLDCLQCPTEQLVRMGNEAHRVAVKRHDIDTEAVKLAQLFKEGSYA